MYIFFHGKTGYTVTSLILFRKIVTGAVTDGYTGGYCNQKRSYNPYPNWQPNRQLRERGHGLLHERQP